MNKFLRRQLGMKKVDRVMRVWLSRDKWVYREYPEFAERERQRLYKTRKVCSCPMCGNRRIWAGDTRQEQEADLLMADDLRSDEAAAHEYEIDCIMEWEDAERFDMLLGMSA